MIQTQIASPSTRTIRAAGTFHRLVMALAIWQDLAVEIEALQLQQPVFLNLVCFRATCSEPLLPFWKVHSKEKRKTWRKCSAWSQTEFARVLDNLSTSVEQALLLFCLKRVSTQQMLRISLSHVVSVAKYWVHTQGGLMQRDTS